MEPQLPNPNFVREQASPEGKKPEAAPSANSSGLEALPSQPIEQLRSTESHERAAGTANSAASLAATLPVVIPSNGPVDDTTQALGQIAAISASNDDVIEKEWINKSKKIVKETKGDPYRKEHEVSKLQADYLHKRYGKEVRVPDDV